MISIDRDDPARGDVHQLLSEHLADMYATSTLHGEIKSMRTTASARGRGVATLILRHILDDARARDLERVYLETGTEDYFAPARRLYARNGFTECPPFAGYTLDPNSVFMELPSEEGPAFP